MSLIQDTNRDRDPRNDARVEIPRINVALDTTGMNLTPAAPAPRPTDGGASAEELMNRPIVPIAGVENLTPEAGPSSGFQEMVAAAENQIRGEFNWRRNALTQMTPVPLYDSSAGNPWVTSPGIVTPRLDMTPARPSQRLRSELAQITGIDPQGLAVQNAFTQTNLVNQGREGPRPNRLGQVMQRLGFRNDNIVTRAVANLAGVGGAALNISDAISDATGGFLFNQTFGRLLYGSPQEAQRRVEESRANDYLSPARELGAYFLEPAPGESPFGVYGSGLPGMINMASDYVPNLIAGTGLSAWRGARTITSAIRGEEYNYRWDDPLFNALNPLGNDEVYSFFEDPTYSPLSLRRYVPEELGEDATTAERVARRVAVVSLGTLGFFLDAGRPDIDSLSDIGRWASRASSQGGAAARVLHDPMPPASPTQALLPGRSTPMPLPGPAPDQPLLPGGSLPFDPGPGPELDLVPYRSFPPQPPTSAAAQIDYETLFTTPDGVALQMPLDIVQRVDETINRGRSVLSQPFPDAPGRPLIEVDEIQLGMDDIDRTINELDPDGEFDLNNDMFEGVTRDDLDDETLLELDQMRAQNSLDAEVDPEALAAREADIERMAAERQQLEELYNNARTPEGDLDPQAVQRAVDELPDDIATPELEAKLQEAIDAGDMDALDQIIQDEFTAFDQRLESVRSQLDEAGAATDELADGANSLEELVARADQIVPPVEVPPVRLPGVAESLIRQAVDAGDLEVRPTGFVRADAAVEEAQKRLISVRLELDQIKRIPETFRNGAERARFTQLTDEFENLRTQIAGRAPRSMAPSPLDEMLPVVTQRTLTPPANPAQLYQWSRNLPPGQRIYLDDVEFDTRKARDLTELAKFFGHANVARNTVLTGDQLAQLRATYGSLYSNFGPAIDRDALKRLNVEGTGRVEVEAPDPVSGKPQETRLYSNDVARSFDQSVKRAEEFGTPTRYTQSEMSELASDEIQRLLDTQFSSKAVYASGSRNAALARTRAELMDELRFRDGEDIEDLAVEADDIDSYLDAIGDPDLDPTLLDDEAFNRLAEEAAISAVRKADVPVEAVKKTLPDEMKPRSPQGDEAVREMVAAEQGVTDAMQPVRELVEIIENLEREMAVDGRALQAARIPQHLNVGVYDETANWKTRQMQVDQIADRTVTDISRVSQPAQSVEGVNPVAGRSTRFGDMPETGTAIQTLGGRRGTLTGSRIGSGADAQWEVRLEDGSVVEVPPTEVFAPDATIVRPDEASTRVWYLGTRADINIADYNGVYDSTMHSPLGPGTYLMSDPKVAEDAARAYVKDDAVANYPIATQGSVSTVAAQVDTVMSGDMALMSMEEVWVGTRNLIKEFFGDNPADVRNITTAARRKNLVEFYDYLARKLDDDVRLFDFQGRMAVFLHAQGIDAIKWDSPNGSVLNVIKPNSLVVGDTTRLGADRALEQMAAATNYDQSMASVFNTQTARDVASHSHYRFGLQLRDKFVGHLQQASERVYKALERLDRADEALERIAQSDAVAEARRTALEAREQFNRFVDETDLPGDCL